jgi:hypothetical protein
MSLLPTAEELAFLKEKWSVYRPGMTYGDKNIKQVIIDKLEKGWDVKEFYSKSIHHVYKHLVAPICIYSICLAITGIVLSRYDCTEEYCYNVNQFLWIFFGAIINGYFILTIVESSFRSYDSEFITYFSLSFGNFSHLFFTMQNSISLLLMGTIVNFIYIFKTSYLRVPLVIFCLIQITGIFHTHKIIVTVQKEIHKPIQPLESESSTIQENV